MAGHGSRRAAAMGRPAGPRDRSPLAMHLFAVAVMVSGSAAAQTKPVTTAASLLIPLEPADASPAYGTGGGYSFNLSPVGADFGRLLADHGVYLVAKDLAEGIGQVSGGVKRGGSFEGLTNIGFDLDMARMAGVHGGVAHFLADDLQGRPPPPTRAAPTSTTASSPATARRFD